MSKKLNPNSKVYVNDLYVRTNAYGKKEVCLIEKVSSLGKAIGNPSKCNVFSFQTLTVDTEFLHLGTLIKLYHNNYTRITDYYDFQEKFGDCDYITVRQIIDFQEELQFEKTTSIKSLFM